MKQREFSPKRALLEIWVSSMLRAGVVASLALLALGSVVSFVDGSYDRDIKPLTSPQGAFPRTSEWLASGLLEFHGPAVIVAGLLLLIATPLLRVAVSLLAFAREKDSAYAFLAGSVLFLLLLSFVIGRI